jgi:uncharacterized protein (TIGR02594 family)
MKFNLFEAIRKWWISLKTPKKQKPVKIPVKEKKETPFDIARSQLGIAEIVGRKHNKKILEYHRLVGGFSSDEIAWCSSFVNYCAYKSGYERSYKANARSWLKVGLNINYPEIGDIVIFWRGSKDGWQGHVGFYAGEKGSQILVLGGNQSNKVNYQYYPKSRLLGYRRLKKL